MEAELLVAGGLGVGVASALLGVLGGRKTKVSEISLYTQESEMPNAYVCDHTAYRADNVRGWTCRCGRHVHRFVARSNGDDTCVCGERKT